VRAFLTGGSTKAICQDLVDFRYCYTDDKDRGCVTSGIVREELHAILEREDHIIRLSTNGLKVDFQNAVGSPSVLAFMARSNDRYFDNGNPSR
jgi:hypothetical protein